MTETSAIIALVGAAGICLVALLYLRREPGGRPRLLLMALRMAALAVLVLLLIDPTIPGTDPSRPAPAGGGWFLLDPDLSLTVTDPETGEPLWEDAVARATEGAAAGARVALARPEGSGPEAVGPSTLSSRTPEHPPGDLLGAVRRLGEVSADSIVVLSTLRRPPGFIESLAAVTPVPIRLVPLGGRVANAGVEALELPESAPTDEPIEGRVSIFGEGGQPADTVLVELRADGELRQTIPLPLPPPGQTASAPVRLPAPADTGMVRYTARVRLQGDRFPIDDLRAGWVRVGEPEGGILLVSLVPDWEPRVLLPTLEAVTGLDGEGYLSVGEDRFLPLGTDDQGTVPAEALQGRLGSSELLVVQAPAGPGVPDWLQNGMEAHPAVLRLLTPGVGGDVEGLEIGPSRTGEWTATAELPASPLGPFLSGAPLSTLPPLTGLRVVGNPGAGIIALAAGRGTAEPDPALVLRETETGRRAVALADGFWRWGSRDGEGRGAYRGLWGGTAGWLLDTPGGPADARVRPLDPVQTRAAPLRWAVPVGATGLEIELTRIHDGGEQAVDAAADPDGPSAYRAPLEPGDDGVATTPPVEPGVYRYEVAAAEADGPAPARPVGLVEVERWAPSLRTPPLEPASRRIEPIGDVTVDEALGGRPLRTHPLPYLLLLGLLCAEWLGRRKLGLR